MASIRDFWRVCAGVNPVLPPPTLAATPGDYHTIILQDLARMQGTATDKDLLARRLAALAARPEVMGKIVDISVDGRVIQARSQSDNNPGCPYAKNLLASAVKDVIDRYRALNPLEYIVLVGNDDVIPFFRYPDPAQVGFESDYIPPVLDSSASGASLRLNYVWGQDAYGATTQISLQGSVLPIPDLAVGRLVETAGEAVTVLDAYLSDADGIVQPASAFISSYGFLEDGARAVQRELEAGLNSSASVSTLIDPADRSPSDPRSWTADNLRAGLLTSRRDLVYLAGHFSAAGALAADYTTHMDASEVALSPLDLRNIVVYSAGCHTGYNIVNAHGVPGLTPEPDWAQAFARKGAALIAGTGYQYGDADLTEYAERLYLGFTQQLRRGGPIAIGKALVGAKQDYLADTGVEVDGVFEKTILQPVLFGLPMLRVQLPGQPGVSVTLPPVVTATNPVIAGPGATYGLRTADVSLSPQLTPASKTLTDVATNSSVVATYLIGPQGAVARDVGRDRVRRGRGRRAHDG